MFFTGFAPLLDHNFVEVNFFQRCIFMFFTGFAPLLDHNFVEVNFFPSLPPFLSLFFLFLSPFLLFLILFLLSLLSLFPFLLFFRLSLFSIFIFSPLFLFLFTFFIFGFLFLSFFHSYIFLLLLLDFLLYFHISNFIQSHKVVQVDPIHWRLHIGTFIIFHFNIFTSISGFLFHDMAVLSLVFFVGQWGSELHITWITFWQQKYFNLLMIFGLVVISFGLLVYESASFAILLIFTLYPLVSLLLLISLRAPHI